jgi:hypothetical protein
MELAFPCRSTPYVKKKFRREGGVYDTDGVRPRLLLTGSARLDVLKHQQFLEDTRGVRGSLHHLRNKKGLEVDSLLVEKSQPTLMIECKLTATDDVNFKQFESVATKQA